MNIVDLVVQKFYITQLIMPNFTLEGFLFVFNRALLYFFNNFLSSLCPLPPPPIPLHPPNHRTVVHVYSSHFFLFCLTPSSSQTVCLPSMRLSLFCLVVCLLNSTFEWNHMVLVFVTLVSEGLIQILIWIDMDIAFPLHDIRKLCHESWKSPPNNSGTFIF